MSADLFRKLSSLGLSMEQIGGVMDIIEARDAEHAVKDEERKAQIRARVQKFRAKNKPETFRNVTRHDGNGVKPLTRVEDNLQTTEIAGSEEKKDTAPAALSDLQGFKAELSELDAERVEAIVKHRRSKKAQLTAHAARLFKADAAKAGLSLSAAVDTCISRNWVTVKADWLESRQTQPRQASPPPTRTFNDVLNDIKNGASPDAAHSGPTIDTSFERGDSASTGRLVQFHALPSRR